MLRHEIPTHLDVQDKIVLGLTTRQTMHLLVGLSTAAFVWTQLASADALPLVVRFAAVALCLGTALVAALVRPHGRGIEEWAVVVIRFAATPRRAVWRPTSDPIPLPGTSYAGTGCGPTGSSGWFDYSPAAGAVRSPARVGPEAQP